MKNKALKWSVFVVIALITASILLSTTAFSKFFSPPPPPPPQYISDEQNDIIGTWISETDANWKLIFNSGGTCENYYQGALTVTYSYSISNTTPQCGTNVLVDENQQTSYLQLTDVSNGDHLCYEINGITQLLSLTTVGNARLVVLTKQ